MEKSAETRVVRLLRKKNVASSPNFKMTEYSEKKVSSANLKTDIQNGC